MINASTHRVQGRLSIGLEFDRKRTPPHGFREYFFGPFVARAAVVRPKQRAHGFAH